MASIALHQRASRRRTSISVLAVLVAVLATLGLGRPAAANAHAPQPTATLITVTSLSTPGITVPQTGGTPGAFIVAGVPFTVSTKFTAADGVTLLPISTSQTVTVKLVVASGPDVGVTVGSVDVAAGATSASLSATVDSAANHTSLTAKAFIKNKQQTQVLPGAPFFFSPQKAFVSAAADSQLTSIGSGSGSSAPCQPTAQEPTCAELHVPQGLPGQPALLSSQLLSLGACDPANASGQGAVTCVSDKLSVVQALFQVDPAQITGSNPVVLILKCDKTLCGSQGINKVPVKFAMGPDDAGATPPACDVKAQVQAGTDICIDYRQSTRDNAGDTHLWILLDDDLRVWNG
jgi:hypothetical protein